MTAHLKLALVLGTMALGCSKPKALEPEQTDPDEYSVEETGTIEKAPALFEEKTWVVIASKFDESSARSSIKFFDRLALRDGIFDSRDGSARGFSPVPYVEAKGHFEVKQTSQANGLRQWKCVQFALFADSDLTCSLEWVHGGVTETYLIDDSIVNGDPFEGRWRITLTPETESGEQLAGEATLHRAALDLSLNGKAYGNLVYYVRPPSGFSPVDFLTVPPGQLAPISWDGALMEGGRIVGWEALKDNGNYSIGGRVRISDDTGATTEYSVSSERLDT